MVLWYLFSDLSFLDVFSLFIQCMFFLFLRSLLLLLPFVGFLSFLLFFRVFTCPFVVIFQFCNPDVIGPLIWKAAVYS